MTERTEVRQVHVPRAAKACLACRRQKTRCFPSNDSLSCLRCQSLSRPCSFIKDGVGHSGFNNSLAVSNNGKKRSISEIDNTVDGVNITELDKNVKKILTMLQSKISHHPNSSSTRLAEFPSITTTAPFKTSPFTLISDSVSPQSTPLSIRQLFKPSMTNSPDSKSAINILSLNLITMSEATTLVDKFKECYGRWVSLPNNISTEQLIISMKYSCPVLLTTICATSLRYQRHTRRDEILYTHLLNQLKIELFQEISSNVQSLEFLKALVILCVYGYSLSNPEFTIDPWFISGTAVQKFLTLDVESELLNLENLHESLDFEQEVEKLSNFRVWNHICLVHLVNCVFSSRMCVLDEIRLDQSRKSLDLSQATNFDGRIVSEISLQLLLYNYLQSAVDHANHIDFEGFEQELDLWHEQWNYLFRQPTLQFVEFGYHYVYVVALYHYHFGGKKLLDLDAQTGESGTTIANAVGDDDDDEAEEEEEEEYVIKDKDVLKKFMFHSIKLIDHINGIKDIVYFLCLSDQIHLCTMYTTLLFIKLIKWSHKYTGLSQFDTLELISKAKLIKEKFYQVSQETNDLAYKFATGIQETIDSLLAQL